MGTICRSEFIQASNFPKQYFFCDYNTFPNNTTYYWRLKSLYDTNESNWSNPWNFTTLLKSPLLIKPINGEQDFPLSGFLEWYSVTGATYYKINISERSDFDFVISCSSY